MAEMLTERTLAADYYVSEEILARERRLLMANWQLAAHERQIPEPGDFLALSLFDQDFFLIRGGDGAVRAFWNVCPHRGHRLVGGTGNKARITCPYHAWTFERTGALVGMKRRATTEAPDRAGIALRPVALDRLAGFLFLNPTGTARPISDIAPGLEAQMLAACPDLPGYVMEEGPALGHSYECAANWKVLIDNYLECHHCAVAHHSFNDMMDIPNARFELFPNYTFQRAPTKRKANNRAFPLDLDHDVTVGQFWWFFPNTVFGQFPGVPGFYASRLEPLSPDKTERRTLSLTVARPTDPDMARRQRLRSDWSVNVVSREDRALCESVQRGMRQWPFDRGWYVTDPQDHGISEHAMRHFHQTYLDAMEAECISG